MGKIFTLSFCVLISLRLYAQTSETHNFITYDTTYNGPVGTWQIRITRPVNMFTPGSADTASRPAIITMPGIGETGNANPANLTAYGPHYWLLNGWDGSVVLGNGVHYPILITVAFVSNTWPAGEQTSDVLSFLLSHYHIKKSSVHLGGLSLGSFMWTSLIAFEATPGAETGMSMVTSITALEGFSLYEDAPYSTWSRGDVAYQVWAQKYHGKYFGLEGTDDYRNVAEGEKDMNSVVPGSAHFSYENLGGGAHCCWNSMYDPNQQNWQSFPTYGPYVATGADTNSRGDYHIGSSIFQWMLRQGDTSMVGGTVTPRPVANAGADQVITLPVNTVALAGSGTESGGTISSYAWTWVSGPAQYSFNSTSLASPTVSNLVAGIYVFKLTVTDAYGVSASANVSVTVNAAGVPSTTYYNLPGTVQAANYASLSGVATATAQTLASTTSIPSINSGEMITYNVNVASAGVYTMSFQVASGGTGAGFQVLNSAGAVLSTIAVPDTWTLTSWATVNVVVNLAAGQQTLSLLSTQTTAWALNWFSSVAGSAGQQVIPGTIQAENYSTMLGVGTQTTADAGGGLNVDWITYKDYMSYPVNVQTTGSYTVSFRVATVNSGASLQLDNGSTTVYANVTIPNTGGWQTWTTVTASVNLTAGVQTIRVLSNGGTGIWNINWMSYALLGSGGYSIPGMIQAENFASSSGVSTQTTTDAGGGSNVDYIDDGDWMTYNVDVASAGSYTVGLRVASTQVGASFALESTSGVIYATVSVPNTGAWQSWTTVYQTVQLPAGVQTLKVVSLSAIEWNINWMSFSPVSSVVYPIPGLIQSEDYESSFNISTQTTTDVGGGLNVDYIYNGDWMIYNVNVASAGTYTVGLRLASIQPGAILALENTSGTVYATVSVPNTGAWQTWTTVYATVTLPAGVQTLKVVSLGVPLWNINWMSFTLAGTTTTSGTDERTGEYVPTFSDSLTTYSGMLLLYPNPTLDAFQLTIDNGHTGKFIVQVITPAGRLVKTYSFQKGLPEFQTQVSLSGLPAGVYLIRVGGDDWQEIRKLVKL